MTPITPASPRSFVRPADLVAAALALSLGTIAHAAPEGSQTVRGNVSITRTGDETVIRASDRSIINHRSFDIAAGERVRFIQPSADARVLNRITGAAPTRIDGALTANGRVYIVNPAGVVFGRTATVDVAGLFAAAGKLSDADFVSGVDRVTQMQGRVANEGTIRAARAVTLAGSQVANVGSIVSPQGNIALAAGENVVVSDRGSTMFVRVDGPATGDATTAGVTNSGTLDTSSPLGGGRVILAAGDVYGLAIKHTGSATGESVQLQGSARGDVIVDGGTISTRNQKALGTPRAIDNWQSPPIANPKAAARGEARRSRTGPGVTLANAASAPSQPAPTLAGGSITIAGDRIAVFNSSFDASGNAGGGQVKIGGDVQGASFAHDATLQQARAVAVNQDTTIRADALERGDGGSVVLFARNTTRTNAAISATGGAQGGDGGFIETSGVEHIDVRADRIDASAKSAAGKAGVWLIDPRDVTISSSATTGGAFDAGTPDVFTPTSDSSIVQASDIISRLDSGTSVTITTGSDGAQPGNISVQANLTLSPSSTDPVTLRLEAANDIIVADGVAIGSSGAAFSVELLANTISGTSTDLDPAAGSILLGDNVAINSNAGAIRLVGADIGLGLATALTSSGGDIALSASGTITTANGVSLTSDGGDITLSAPTLTFGTTTLDHSISGGGSTGVTTLRSNAFSLTNLTITGDGELALETRSPGVTIGVGTGAAGTYSISDGDLSTLAGLDITRVTIGRATSGLLTTASGLGFSGAGSSLRLRGTSADLSDITLTGSFPLELDFSTAVTQSANLTVTNLIVRGSGALDLSNPNNLITNLAGNVTGSLTLRNAQNLTVNNIASDANGLALAGTSELRATGGTVTIAAPLAIASGGVTTLTGDDVEIISPVTGPGALVLQPDLANADVRFGAPGVPSGFVIRTNDIAQFGASLASVTIGRADGSGTLQVDSAVTMPTALTLRMGAGNVIVPFTLSSTGSASSIGITSGLGTTLSSDIVTAGAPILLGGPITLATNVTLDTTNAGAVPTGGFIQIFSALDADDAANARQLTANAGSSGTINLFGELGSSESLGSFFAIANAATLKKVTTSGNQFYAANTTTLDGDLTSSFTSIVFQDAVALAGSSTLNAGTDITFGGAVTDSGTNSLSARALAGTVRAKNMSVGSLLTIEAQTFAMDGDLAGGSLVDIGNASTILQRDATITTGAARVGVLNSEAGETNDLIINASASTQLIADIGQATDGQLGSLASDAAGTITISSARINLANNLAIGDTTTLANNLEVAAGGSITFGGTVDSDATPRSLNATSTGDTVRFAGLVGNGAALTTLTAAGTSIELNDDIRTTGAQTYNGPVLLTDDVRLASPAITFSSTLDSSVFERNFIVDAGASGTLSFVGAVGAQTALRSMDLTAQTISVQNGAITTGAQRYAGTTRTSGTFRALENGNIEFANDVLLTGATTVTSAGNSNTQGVTFKGLINSLTTSFPLTVNSGGGAIRFEAAVGPGATGIVAPANIAASGNAIDILADITTAGSQLYTGTISLRANLSVSGTGSIGLSGATTLLSDSTLTTTAGDILFGGTLNSDDTARALIVNTGGNATTRFSGAVGGTNRLSSLTTNADGTTILAATQVRTINDQVYNDAVRLGANITLEGNDINFASTLNSDATTTPRNLIVNTATISGDAGDTTFAGRVGGVARLGSITTNADGTTRVGSDIATSRAISFGDAVLLLNSSTIDAGSGSIFFRNTLDADTTATDPNVTLLSSATGDLDAPAFRFGTSVGGTRRLGSLTLGADRASPARAATIIFSDAFDSQGRVQLSGVANTDTFNITLGSGGFSMGAGHKLTAFGSVRVTTTGAITVGDITALGAISLNGDAITIRRRAASDVRLRDRSLARDTGVDFVAGGAIDFSRVPNLTGSGANPTFTPGNGLLDAEIANFISRLPLSPLAVTDFQDPSNTQLLLALDQRSTGSTRTVISDAILMVTPRLAFPEPSAARPPQAGDLALLAELGIPTQDETMDERVDALAGRSFDDRLPLTSGFEPASVPVVRITPRAAARVANAYRALALEPLTDASGNPVLDDAGRPRTVSRTDELRNLLGESWERYTQTTTTPTGAGWRRALESEGSTGDARDAQALRTLNQAREFLLALNDLALAPATLEVPKAKVLGELQPAQIPDAATLEQAILGGPRLTVMR